MIQSKEREALFFKSIEIDTYKNDLQTFYLPVCLNEMSEKSPKSRNSILRYIQIGGINEFRSCSTSILKNFNYKIGSLCFHGFINPNFKKVYQTENYKAELSDIILSSQQLQDKIYTQFDVGVLGYIATDANFREIALASGQFAEFIRAFKPIISIGDHSLTDFVNTHKLGIGIRTIDDFQDSLQQMDQNYDQFVTNVFEFSKSFGLKDFSSRLADKIVVDVA